jgi:excisionase family DNA binding protein
MKIPLTLEVPDGLINGFLQELRRSLENGKRVEVPLVAPPVDLGVMYVSVREAAKLLSISKSKLYEMLAKGEIESRLFGSSRRIPVEALHKLGRAE